MNQTRFKLQLSSDQIKAVANVYSGFLIDEWILKPEIVDWLDKSFPDDWSYDFFYSNHITFSKEHDALLFKLRWL